jgi:hypothetical protein
MRNHVLNVIGPAYNLTVYCQWTVKLYAGPLYEQSSFLNIELRAELQFAHLYIENIGCLVVIEKRLCICPVGPT